MGIKILQGVGLALMIVSGITGCAILIALMTGSGLQLMVTPKAQPTVKSVTEMIDTGDIDEWLRKQPAGRDTTIIVSSSTPDEVLMPQGEREGIAIFRSSGEGYCTTAMVRGKWLVIRGEKKAVTK